MKYGGKVKFGWLSFLAAVTYFVLRTSFSVPTAQAATGINTQINFQARLQNAQGATVPDGNYNIEFKVYQDGTGCVASGTSPCGGTLKWTEDWLNTNTQGVTVKNGYFSVLLGSVNTALGTSVDFNQDTLWLSLNIGNTGSGASFAASGGDGEMLPFKRFAANPYALNAGKVGGLDKTQFVQLAQGLQGDASTANASIAINKTGTTANVLQLQRGGVDVQVIANDGSTLFKNQADSTTGFRIQSASAAQTLLTADTTNNKIKIGDSTGTDTATTVLQVDAATADPTTSLATRNGGLFYNSTLDQLKVIENGAVARVCTTTSVCSGYAPASGATGYVNLQSSTPGSQQSGNINISGVIIAGSAIAAPLFQTSDAATASAALTVRSGNTTGGSGLSTGAVAIKSGDGSGTDTSSGNVTVDAGAKSGAGVTGTVTVGGGNASALTLGRSGLNVVIPGTATIQGANSLTLGTATNLGAILFKDGTADGFTGTLKTTTLSASQIYTLGVGGLICTDAGNCAGAGATLQTAYNFSAGSTTPEIILNNGGTDTGGVDIQNNNASPVSGQLFTVRANAASGLGSLLFGVSDTGAVTASTSFISGLLQTADGSAASSALAVRTGTTTGGSGLSTGNLTVSTGDGSGTNTSSGNITFDTGVKTGTGTSGTITVAGTNASALTLGRSGLTVTNAGNELVQGGTLTLGTTSNTGTIVLKNSTTANSLTLQSGATGGSGLTLTLPNADGNSLDCLKTNGSGVLTFSGCLGGGGGGVTSINTLQGVLSLNGTTNQVSVASGGTTLTLSTPQDINTTSSAILAGLRSGAAPSTLTTVTDNPLSSGSNTINVASTTGYPVPTTVSPAVLQIDSEVMTYTGVTSTTFTGVVRGVYGTTAAAHSSGAAVNNYLLHSVSSTSTAPKFVVQGNGNVGIGVVAPAGLLSVGSTSQFQVSSAGAVTGVGVNSGAGLLQGSAGLTVSGTITFSSLATNGAAYLSGGVLGSEAQLAPARGGTGIGSYTIGDLLYASGATTLSKLADVAAGSVLASGGAGAAPIWALATAANTCSDCIIQNPTTTARNTITPISQNGVVALTVTGTTGTAATALSIIQGGNATAQSVTSSGTGNIGVYSTSNAAANGISIAVQSSSSSQYALSVTSNAGSTQDLYVRADGNVGIGTAGPTAQLQVAGTNGVSGGTGTAGTAGLTVVAGNGGNSSTAATAGGAGGAISLTSGAGGNSTGVAGTNGANITLQGGAGGTGSTAGSYGNVVLNATGGNVGIGTASPSAPLNVNQGSSLSGITLDSPSSNNQGAKITLNDNIGAGTYTALVQLDNSGNLVLRQSQGSIYADYFTNFYIRNSSFVSTLTANSSTLSIGRASTPTASTLQVYDATATTGATQLLIQGGAVAADAAANQLFRVNQGGGTTGLFVVQGNGNVGIGTTGPGAQLHVVGTAGVSGGTGTAGTAGLTVVAGNGGNSSTAATAGGAGGAISLTSGAGGNSTGVAGTNGANISLQGGAGGTGTTAGSYGNIVLNTSGGNVGIGTAAPTGKLSIVGTSDIIQTLIKGNATQTANILEINPGSSSNVSFAVNNTGQASFWSPVNANVYLTVGSTGYTGISSASGVNGISATPVNGGTGDIYGVTTQPVSTATGTVNNLIGVNSGLRTANAGLTVINGFDFYAAPPTISSGAITNQYGIYIPGQKITGVTSGYGVYQTGATDLNYFAGNVGIGTSGTPAQLLSVGGTTGNLTVNSSGDLVTAGTLTVNGSNFTNAGSTLNTVLALGNFATGGSIGSAAATVDAHTGITINQTTTLQTLTMPSPTNTAAGRLVYVSNIGSASFTLLGATLSPATSATLVWNGTAWTYAGADGSSIVNQNTTNQTANFRITGSGQANTSLLTPLVDVASAGTLSLGTATATAITIGKAGVLETNLGSLTVTQAGTFNGGLTVATGSTLTNASSTLLTAIAIANLASGGNIGTAAATVDVATTFTINQTTTLQTITIPSPTVTTAGRLIYISNIGTANFTMLGATISTGTTATLIWNGTAWTFAGADASSILNQNTTNQTANFRITGTGQANTSYLSPLHDVASAGTLSLGTGTATAITIGKAGVTTTALGPLTVSADSTSAFLAKTTAGTNIFNVDTTTGDLTSNQGALTVNGIATPAAAALSYSPSGGTISSGLTLAYRVAAINLAGASTEASPSSPTSVFTGNGPNNNQTTLTWTAVSGVSNYKVYRTSNGGTNWFVNTVSAGTTTINDNGSNFTWATAGTPPTSSAAGGVILGLGGGVSFNANNGGTTVLQASASAVTSYVLRLPSVQGGVNSVLQNDGSGNLSWIGGAGCSSCVAQVPTTTAQNTISPTANNVVALTVKGTTGTSANVLEIYNSNATPTRQAFFDSSGSLNVAQLIQPTTNNAVDLGIAATAFRSGFFATSVQVPLVQTTDAAASSASLVVRSGNTTGGTNLSTGSITIKSGDGSGTTTNSGNISIDAGAATGTTGGVSIGTTSASSVTIGKTGAGTTVQGNFNIGASAGSGTTATNNGSTVNAVLAKTDFAAGGSIGTAATTVDIYSAVSIAQTTAAQTITIPTPTANTTYGRLLYISNIGTASFILLGSTLNPGSTATLIWSNTNSGATWQFAGADGSAILNQNTAFQAATFSIQSNAASSVATAVIKQAGGQTGDLFQLQPSGSATPIAKFSSTGALTVSPTASTSGSPSVLTVTAPAHTGLANAEAIDANINLARTVTFTGGASTNFATQRALVVAAPTYATTTATLTITDAATQAITGAPVKGANVAITNTHAFLIQSGAVGAAANSYGLTVNAQTGATNNYAAQFLGGSVGIGTTAPTATLHVAGANQVTAATAALQVLQVTGGSGGTAGAGQTGGVGAIANITAGTGGASTSVTGTPGAGGTIALVGGAGGAGTSTSVNGSGGNVSITSGAAGTGGSGAVGNGGNLNFNAGAGGNTAANGSINLGTTTAKAITLGNGTDNTTLTLQGTGLTSLGGGLTVGASAGSGTTLTNNGSTVNSALSSLGDFPSGGSIGTAANTVDKYTYIAVPQTTASQTLTIPTPTANTTYGRLIYISNTGTASFTLLGSTLNAGSTATLIWANVNSTPVWTYAGADGTSILNQNTANQTANFRITGTGQANASFLTPLLDAATASTTLAIGTTNANQINLNQNTTIAAAKTLTVTSALTSLTGATSGDALNVSNSTSAGNIAVFKSNATAVATFASTGNVTFNPLAATSGSPTIFTLSAPAHTGLANAEAIDANLNLARTVTFTGGASTNFATQRALVVAAPTYAATTATLTITDAATHAITGAPSQGANVAITNSHGLLIQAGASNNATNAYGLTVNAPTGSATNKYAAAFLGGNVGIGTAAPTTLLHVKQTAAAATGETIARFDVSDDSTANLTIKNNSNTNSEFLPTLVGTGSTAQTALLLQGIGTTDTGTTPIVILDSRLSGAVTVATRPIFDLRNNGSSKLLVDASGNVGIGTTGPSAQLHVVGTAGVSGGVGTAGTAGLTVVAGNGGNSSTAATAGGAGGAISLTSGSGGNSTGVGGTNGANISLQGGAGGTGSTAGSYGNIVLNATGGNVGVGNSTPQYKLDVSGQSRFSAEIGVGTTPLSNVRLNIGGTQSGAGNVFGSYTGTLTLTPSNASDAFFQLIGGGIVDTGAGNTINNSYNIYSAPVTKAGSGTITNTYGLYVPTSAVGTNNYGAYFGGNVGIGTATPGSASGAKLDVAGRISAIGSTGEIGITRRDTSGNAWSIYSQTGNFSIYDQASSSDKFTILGTSGNVGIGTTGPSAQLHVVGTAGVSGGVGTAGTAGLTVVAGNGGNSSTAATAGGAGGAISLTSGNGGNSTGVAGANGANIVIQTGSGGTGSVAGSYGNLLLNATGGNVGIGTSGTPAQLLSIGGTTGNLTVTGAGDLVTAGNVTVNTGKTFTNSSSTLNTAIALGNLDYSGSGNTGTIGTAAATVNVATSFTINQSTAGQTLTIPSPTTTTAGRIIYISNIGSVNFTMLGAIITAGTSATVVWNGTAWTFAGADGSSILNQTAVNQTANFKITGVGQANGGFVGPSLDVAASATLSLGTAAANTAITIGRTGITTTNAGSLTASQLGTFNGGLTLATGNTLTNASSTLNTAIPLGNFNYTGSGNTGSIGTAATTVDVATTFTIAQTTSGQTLTISSPTATTAGRVIYISNTGSANFNMLGALISAGTSATLVWNGTAWTFAGADGSSILNQNAVTQTANFLISGTGQSNGGFLAPSLDVASSGTLSVGTSGNNTAITLGRTGITTTSNGHISIAANHNLSLLAGTGVFSQTFSGTTQTPFSLISTFAPSAGATQTNFSTTVTNAPTSTANTIIGHSLTLNDATALANTIQGFNLALNDTGSTAKTIRGAAIDFSSTTNTAAVVTGQLIKTGATAFSTAPIAQKIQGDSTQLVLIQNNAGTNTIFTADTTNKKIKLGTGTPGLAAGTTGALYVSDTAEIAGAIRVGTGNGIDFTPGTAPTAGAAPFYKSGSQPTKTITLVPEYAGAVLDPDGSNNLGTMLSDFCSNTAPVVNTGVCSVASDRHNYYSWSSTQASAQDYDLYLRYSLPSDFVAFSGGITVNNRRTNTGDNLFATIYNSAGTVCDTGGTADEAIGSTVNTWIAGAPTISNCSAGTFTANSTITIKLKFSALSSRSVQAGEISFSYLSAF